MKHVLALAYALSLLSVSVMAQSIDPPNIVGSLSIVSPPEAAPVNNIPGKWTAVPGLSTLVQSRGGDNLEITVSAEVMTASAVWLAASVDGAIIAPDVVFKRGGTFWDGSRSFTFVQQGLSSGAHTVEIVWFTNAGTSAQIRDRSLSVSSASPVWGAGRLAVAVPASGPDLVKDGGNWENIPGLSTTIATDAAREFKMTFSGEVGPGTGRFSARALLDGGYVADVVVDSGAAENGGTRSFTFVKNSVPAGTHTVTMQWLASGGQIRLGDRTLAVTASPSTTPGGGLVARGFESAPTGFYSTDWVDIPNTTQSFLTNELSTNLQLTFGAEARATGGRLFLRALIDGRPLSPGDITYVGAGSTFRAQSYSFVQKNITPGQHTVRFQASVDTSAYGEIADTFVTALFKRRPGADFAQPYMSLAPKSSGSAPPVVVIGFDPHRAGVARPTMQQLQNQHRGDDGGPSMRSWYLENSGGRYAPSNFTFLGWYDAPIARQGTWYWDTVNFELMWQDALIAADAAFNFRQYDTNGDGHLSSTELAVEVVRPQINPSGTNRGVSAPLDGTTLYVDIIDIYMSADEGRRTENVGLLSHEMAHAILGAPDMYFGSATRPGYYSLMDDHVNATHLDPFLKLKSGFISPDVIEINILTPRTVPLTAIEQKGASIILYSPSYRTDQEYFIIENRWGGTASRPNYDAPILQGVVVWHIVQDPTLMNQFPPAGTKPVPSDWGRMAVRRVAVLNAAGDYVDLKWANGNRSSVRITARDRAQETVNVEINRN